MDKACNEEKEEMPRSLLIAEYREERGEHKKTNQGKKKQRESNEGQVHWLCKEIILICIQTKSITMKTRNQNNQEAGRGLGSWWKNLGTLMERG